VETDMAPIFRESVGPKQETPHNASRNCPNRLCLHLRVGSNDGSPRQYREFIHQTPMLSL